MNTKAGSVLMLLGGMCLALMMLKLMYDMSANMTQMAGHIGSLSADVTAMRTSMEQMADDMSKMRESMQHMDANIQSMGGAVKQGGKLFQQWNPTEMMR